MLFRKKIDRYCTYCQFAGKIDGESMVCQFCGVVPSDHHCRRFRYDHLCIVGVDLAAYEIAP